MVVAALPLSISVHANQVDAVDEVCTAALGCTQSDLLGQVLMLVVTGLIAVFILAVVHRVSEARVEVNEERSRTATEQQAYARFARRVARIDSTQPSMQLVPADGVVATAAAVSGPPTDQSLDLVRSAYEQTVMSMAHYEEEYDEPLAHHMGQEFGEEVATAVTDGDRLTPPLKDVLVDRARDAARDRERLITRLDHEFESLEDAHRQLTAVAATIDEAEAGRLDGMSFSELTDEWNRLGEYESRLSRLLARRQEALQANAVTGTRVRHPSLNDYLYGGLDTKFPILGDATALVDRVRAARGRVLRALTARA